MEYQKENSAIYLRIDRGENILETITKVCKKENVCGGYFLGNWHLRYNGAFILHTGTECICRP